MFCNSCGTKLPEKSAFCNNCGNKVIAIEQEDNSSKNDEIKTFIKEESNTEIKREDKSPMYISIGCLSIVIIFIIMIASCAAGNTPKPKKIEDYTYKDMENFLDWKEKQNKKERDNTKVFQ